MEIKGKILAKKGDNKAFKLSDDNWYNLNDNVVPYLEKLSKGDEIIVTYEKKGVSRYVSKLTGANAVVEPKKETTSTGFACEACGKELKDNKYKTCYTCNKKGATKSIATDKETKTYTKTSYDNPEKTAQIQRGNALNAAAAVASSQQFADPETASQFTKMLADELLEWLRAE